MNIFILDIDPKKSAQYHSDRHCIKMILETSQLLCTAHWETGTKAPYKSTHKNHPCSKWTRKSLANYNWLCNLGVELCTEYSFRYEKRHKSQDVIEWCMQNKPNIQDIGLTKFVQAMPTAYKNDDVVVAYRNYYNGEKKHLFKWKKRACPCWAK